MNWLANFILFNKYPYSVRLMELNYKFGRLPSYTRLTFIVSAIVLFSISIQLYQHEQSFENLKLIFQKHK